MTSTQCPTPKPRYAFGSGRSNTKIYESWVILFFSRSLTLIGSETQNFSKAENDLTSESIWQILYFHNKIFLSKNPKPIQNSIIEGYPILKNKLDLQHKTESLFEEFVNKKARRFEKIRGIASFTEIFQYMYSEFFRLEKLGVIG